MKHRLLLATTLSLPLALAACGGGGSDDGTRPATGSTPGQASTLLQLTQLAGSRDSISTHVLSVPPGAMKLDIRTSGGTGNVDVAVLGPRSRECESISAGNDEHCELPSPAAGTWQVGLLGMEDYAGVSLTAVLTVPGPARDAVPDPAPVPEPEPEPEPAPEPAPAPVPVPVPVPVPAPAPEPEPPPPPEPEPAPVPTPDPPPAPKPDPVPVPVPPPPPPEPEPEPPPVPEPEPPPVPEPPPPEPAPEPPPASGPAPSLLNDGALLPRQFASTGSRVFFIAGTGSSGPRLWISDATVAGTRQLHDSLQPAGLLALGSGALFTARDPDTRLHALWHADASGNVRLLRTFGFIPGSAGDAPTLIGVYAGRAYLIADDGLHGRELWSSDGSRAGTRMIADIGRRGDAGFEAIDAWTAWQDRLYFLASDGGRRSETHLYSTDGTPGSLQRLTDSGPTGSLSGYDMAVFRGHLYFTWNSRDDGVELWRTDGSAAGTQLFFDALPGRDRDGAPTRFTVAGGRLLFSAFHPGHANGRRGLFASDGTTAGTTRISTVEVTSSAGPMVAFQGRYFFAGRAPGQSTASLWATDGTAGGTVEISAAVEPSAAHLGSRVAGTAVLGDRLLFLGRDAAGDEPWVTDGTRVGTMRLADLHPGSAASFGTRDGDWVAVSGGKAYFTAAVSSLDHRLFETDGTAEGTREVLPDDATVRANTRGDGRDPLPAPIVLAGKLVFGARYYTEGPAVLFGL